MKQMSDNESINDWLKQNWCSSTQLKRKCDGDIYKSTGYVSHLLIIWIEEWFAGDVSPVVKMSIKSSIKHVRILELWALSGARWILDTLVDAGWHISYWSAI